MVSLPPVATRKEIRAFEEEGRKVGRRFVGKPATMKTISAELKLATLRLGHKKAPSGVVAAFARAFWEGQLGRKRRVGQALSQALDPTPLRGKR